MKILVSGGTGFIGRDLTTNLIAQGHKVTVLSHRLSRKETIPKGACFLYGDATKPGPWQDKVANYEVIINLAGASIFRIWSPKGKKEILESRVSITSNLVDALSGRLGQETQFISASGIGYYGFCGDELLDEDSPPGNTFIAHVAVEWEAAAFGAKKFGSRVVLCRFGHVLGKGGGALSKFVAISKLHLGSPWGSGQQWISWIHQQDLKHIILFLLENKDIEGPVNVTSPYPISNREMTRLLGQYTHSAAWIPPIPGFLLRLVAGEFATVFLYGQRVVPKKLLDKGYSFSYETIDAALSNLLEKEYR